MSRLEDALAAGRFVVTSELLTVDSGGLDAVHERFAPFADHVDATNATDNTSAHAHASPLAVAIALKQLGMEPIMQLTCRDRNRLGLEAEIAGAALHGIENVLCLTGDDVTAGDEPEARRVFDLDSIQLLALGSAMARGTYLSGREIDPPPRLFLGAVENSGAPPYDYRVDRALKKARAGARFLQLQVSFRPERLEDFMAEAVEKGLAEQCSLLPSICLTRSPAALRYIDERVPGIEVPAGLIERCERAADAEAECFEVAVELAQHARSLSGVAGLHLISFRREAGIARLCERLGIPPRAEREAGGHGRPVAV
jgi:methylenetetrahydrofolate reductase (NADPH)